MFDVQLLVVLPFVWPALFHGQKSVGVLGEDEFGVVGIHATRITGIRLKDFLAKPFLITQSIERTGEAKFP